MHVLSLLQNKFGLVFFRLFDGALETSNFRFEEARSAITLLLCFLHENTQREKIARVKFAEELGTMSKDRLRWITLVRGPISGIHSLTLVISCYRDNTVFEITVKQTWNNVHCRENTFSQARIRTKNLKPKTRLTNSCYNKTMGWWRPKGERDDREMRFPVILPRFVVSSKM